MDESKIRENYRKLTHYLMNHKLTISTMESATAGQIASLLTDCEGASAILKGAFVTYCNEAKIQQGVPAEIIDTYSVYSKETAEAMARACRSAYRADIGIGITGTMGNVDADNAAHSEVGEVYFAFCIGDKSFTFFKKLPKEKSRFAYKMAVAEAVYEELMGCLINEESPSKA